VSKGHFNKDFGRGFYASSDAGHAERLALRNKRLEEERLKLSGEKRRLTPWLYMYDFDLANLDDLEVKEFAVPDKEWLRFVILNRQASVTGRQHGYDVVIGPTANDNARVTIQSFMAATHGQAISDKSLDALTALLEPERLPWQYFFGTQRAADLLEPKGRRAIK